MGEGDAAAREAETALASVAAPENVAFPDPAEPADEAPTAEPMRAADPLDARDPSPEVLDAPEGADADLEVAPEPEPVDLPADDGALVYAALRSQAIRAIDILLVSPVATKKRGRRTYVAKVNYETAREYCENLNVDGVVGWRLPAVGEAKWLSASNLIRNGIYWTATKADAFGDERIIWNPRANKMRASGQRWRGGRAVCVRFSNPEDPGPG